MTPTTRVRRLLIAGWALSLVLLLILGAILLRALLADDGSFLGRWVRTKAEQQTERVVTLYFSSPGGEGLQPEARTMRAAATPEEEIRLVTEALIEGPRRQSLVRTINPDVRLLNVFVVDDLVVLDFGSELQTTHIGGSAAELLTIYSIVDTITTNFPSIERVQLLVEGEMIDTLAGNVDTRYPFRRNADWILPGEPV